MNNFEKLVAFLNSLTEKAIDFYPVQEGFGRPILEHLNKNQYQILGRTYADCIIISWKKNETALWKDCPVAWIDSEGEPNAVFAQNINEFISLLYFDTFRIYDTLMDIYRKAGQFEFAPEGFFIEDENFAKDNYPDYTRLCNFIENELGIQKPAAPDRLIYTAHNSNLGFESWYKTKFDIE